MTGIRRRVAGCVLLFAIAGTAQAQPMLQVQVEGAVRTAGTFAVPPGSRLADVALAPFVRQFAHVDREWFAQAPLPHLNGWLERFLASDLFASVMAKSPSP